ncbi:MAG: aldehyde dehydrogenase family protein [Elusimicrobia bacterium]|nr:aldehyde dehydrogenase family protein [Elusimicrobiota bacterium]
MKLFSELKKKLFDYGPNPETVKVEFKPQYELFIGGEWAAPRSGKYYDTINPATAKPLAKIAWAGQEDVDRAVEAAQEGLIQWQALSPAQRSRHLFALARVVQERGRELSIAETLNNGKPIRETRDIDIPLVARHFFYHAGWADKIDEAFPGVKTEPLGVIGQIIPWNFPLLMLAWKVAPALACGNTVVLKPSETTPLTALLFAEICQDIGLPAGVVNVATGFGDTGGFIVGHPGIKKIAFTGSTEVGKIIRKAAAGTSKKLSLELGGKSPTIVFEDAPLYQAVEGIMDSIFFNQGQVCCAGSRLFIEENIAEKFITLLKERMGKLRVGDPMDKNTDMGAVNSLDQLNKIRRYVDVGRQEGAECWQPASSCPSEGFFFPPTIFTKVKPSHTIACEEIFGPVLAVMTFRTVGEAIELANNTPFGLAASVWTKDVAKMIAVARSLKAGTVWGNGTNKFDAAAEFGGYKESGFGREGGVQGLWEYVKTTDIARAAAEKLQENHNLPASTNQPPLSIVWKTPKMLIGGKQVRTESGRYYKVYDPSGKKLLANVNQGSRKDIRDAVEAAAGALGSWNKTTAYNRGQILYRMAEMLSSRFDEFAQKISLQTDCSADEARAEVQISLDRLLYYAGWADKYTGSVNPVTQTDFNITYPEAVGIAALIAPQDFPLAGLISKLAPAFASGNASVIVPSQTYPLSATDFIEILDSSDVPSGVVNIVTGFHNELVPILAEHRNVGLIDFTGLPDMGKKVEELSAANLKRVHADTDPGFDWLGPTAQGRAWIRRYLEFKTVWITSGY